MNKKNVLKVIDKRISYLEKFLKRKELWYVDKYAWGSTVIELKNLRSEVQKMK